MNFTSLENKFEAAVGVIESLPENGSFQPSNEMKLSFHALYKQAAEGPCKTARPNFWEIDSRAKYDAWTALGNMDRNTAMEKYIEQLKQIVETMTLNSAVEKFIEVNRETDEDIDLAQMLGHYVPSPKEKVSKEESSLDEEQALLEEIRATKENLQHTMQLLREVSCDKDEQVVPENVSKIIDEDGEEICPQFIERLLDNIDGYLPQKCDNKNNSVIELRKTSFNYSSDDEDLFEDSVDGEHQVISLKSSFYKDCVSDEDENDEVLIVSTDSPKSSDIIASENVLQNSNENVVDKGEILEEALVEIEKEEALEISINKENDVLNLSSEHLDIYLCSKNTITTVNKQFDDEVQNNDLSHASSNLVRPQDSIYRTLDKLAKDFSVMQSRVQNLESAWSLHRQSRSSFSWWPFQELSSSTLMFVVTWPLVTHCLLYMMKNGRK